LEKLLSDDRTYLFAVTLDENVIGYALAYRFPSLYSSDYLAYLYDIEVLPSHKRKGAGRFLMETLLTYFKGGRSNRTLTWHSNRQYRRAGVI